MKRQNTGRRSGRPKKEFDKNIFEGLCRIWCTWEEIESILQADQSTINKWSKRVYGESCHKIRKQFSATGKATLRRNQIHLSQSNAAMAIWLGKQKLDQKENPTTKEFFNGKLAFILEALKNVKSEDEFCEVEQQENEIVDLDDD